MTTIWNETQPGQPFCHVFVIGIGAYYHLLDGKEELSEANMNLGQLTSPPVSARRFTDWVMKRFANEQTPLGSVELLLSERRSRPYILPKGDRLDVDEATMGNIETAFNNWLDRCDEHPDNLAIFYFCGHGVYLQGDQLLLAADYGQNRRIPFGNALNFEKMHKGVLSQCKAHLQCFFVDACSNIPVQGLSIAEAGAEPLLSSNFPTEDHQPVVLVLRAAAEGSSAYGRSREVSRFTNALIQCLDGRGCGSTPENGKWVVTTTVLLDSVHKVLDSLNKIEGGPIQIPKATSASGIAQLHIRDEPPVIPVIMQFISEEEISRADIVLERSWPSSLRTSRHLETSKGKLTDIQAGIYRLLAQIEPHAYEDVDQTFIILPPGPVSDPIHLKEAQ